MDGATVALSGSLAARVRSLTGINPYMCYQCKKCSTGCPVAEFGDFHPAQIMRAVQLGDESMTVDSRFIWLCTGCQTCTTRCPQNIDVAGVMDELKIIAREEGRVRTDMPFANVLEFNYRSFRRWGRLYEVGFIARALLAQPRAALEYLGLGPKMLTKGKIGLFPGTGDRAQMKRMMGAIETAEKARRAEARNAAEGKAPGALGGGP